MGDLLVSDVDNDYPADFTLYVQAGPYALNGNRITPKAGFSGVLTVLVYLNDGIDNRNALT